MNMKVSKGTQIIGREPKYPNCRVPEDVLVVHMVKDGVVTAFPLGGGFAHRIPSREMVNFRKVTAADKKANSFRQAMFSLPSDEDKWLTGWHEGTLWNGWGCPYFEKETADKLMRMLRRNSEVKAKYDAKRDAYVIHNDEDFDDDEYIVKGKFIRVGVKRIKAYPIGAWCWCWDVKDRRKRGD